MIEDIDIDCNSELTLQPSQLAEIYKNIKPSLLRLIVLTSCNCNLHSNININIIYHQLEIDSTVCSIKLEQAVKGEIKEPKRKQKKKNKLKDKKKKHFINQITIVLNHQGQTINVKLFGNGKIVITGAKRLDLIVVMIELLINKIKLLNKDYVIDQTLSLNQQFPQTNDILKFMEKNSLLILQLIDILDIKLPINWHNFLVNKQKGKNQFINQDINDLIDNLFESDSDKSQLLYNFSKIVQIIKIIRPYTNTIITNSKIIDNIIKLFNNQTVNFLVTYDTLPEKITVDVNNYNALFESNMKFDREKFHQVLTDKCQILVNYRPSSYQGLNITYYLKDGDDESKVTFFAFQDGTFMITGSNRWDVIERSYNDMCKILDTYYNDIVASHKKVVKVDDRPVKFDYQIEQLNYTFLNKKTILFSNPRNNYLLKSKGLIKCYLN